MLLIEAMGMAQQVVLRSCHLSLFTMMMVLYAGTSKRFIMDHKAYMYVVECRDGSYYTGYTTDVRNASPSTIVGREPNIHEHACQSNLSMLKVLPVRKRPCLLKPFSSARSEATEGKILSENQDRNSAHIQCKSKSKLGS